TFGGQGKQRQILSYPQAIETKQPNPRPCPLHASVHLPNRSRGAARRQPSERAPKTNAATAGRVQLPEPSASDYRVLSRDPWSCLDVEVSRDLIVSSVT